MDYFAGVDFSQFWDDSYDLHYSKQYMGGEVTEELLATVESELGYLLPKSYIALMKQHNGGIPYNRCYPMSEMTSWAENHITIEGIMGIGSEYEYTLCGEMGSKFMIEEWGYPNIGIMICDTPTGGHTMVMLDYRKCGKDGEPEVVYIDQEDDYKTTLIAKDFETFIMGLVHEDTYYNEDEEYEDVSDLPLEERLVYWHESDQQAMIIEEISNLPEDKQSYELKGILARAYNNANNEKAAIEILESVRNEGESDPLWFFRYGYALYYSDKVSEALRYFQRCKELNPNDQDVDEFIKMCQDKLRH